jgi:hypothetical protein
MVLCLFLMTKLVINFLSDSSGEDTDNSADWRGGYICLTPCQLHCAHSPKERGIQNSQAASLNFITPSRP